MEKITKQIILSILQEVYEDNSFNHETRACIDNDSECIYDTELTDIIDPILSKFEEKGYKLKFLCLVNESFNPIATYSYQGYIIRMEEKIQRYQTFVEVTHY